MNALLYIMTYIAGVVTAAEGIRTFQKRDSPKQTVKVVLDDGAIMPRREHREDAGLDLFSREDFCLWPGGHHTFDTGVHLAIPPGWYGKIESKSGLNIKASIVSCGGVIDRNYTGSITVKLYNFGKQDKMFRKGQKVAQLVLMQYGDFELAQVDALPETDRGDAGFGSTGEF